MNHQLYYYCLYWSLPERKQSSTGRK